MKEKERKVMWFMTFGFIVLIAGALILAITMQGSLEYQTTTRFNPAPYHQVLSQVRNELEDGLDWSVQTYPLWTEDGQIHPEFEQGFHERLLALGMSQESLDQFIESGFTFNTQSGEWIPFLLNLHHEVRLESQEFLRRNLSLIQRVSDEAEPFPEAPPERGLMQTRVLHSLSSVIDEGREPSEDEQYLFDSFLEGRDRLFEERQEFLREHLERLVEAGLSRDTLEFYAQFGIFFFRPSNT